MKYKQELTNGQEVRVKALPEGGLSLAIFENGAWVDSMQAESFAMLLVGQPIAPPPAPKEKVVYVDFETRRRLYDC